jgi:hypothetical protein
MKYSKASARNAIDSFFSTLRNFNGGTQEENARMATHCLVRLNADSVRAQEIAAAPSKLLAADAHLMCYLNEIPQRVANFRIQYSSANG